MQGTWEGIGPYGGRAPSIPSLSTLSQFVVFGHHGGLASIGLVHSVFPFTTSTAGDTLLPSQQKRSQIDHSTTQAAVDATPV